MAEYLNETMKVIGERYSCRSFSAEPVPKAYLSAIADAAIQSPSGMNRQSWRVIVIRDAELIGELEAECIKVMSGMPDKALYERIMSRGGKPFYNAPCMMAVPVGKVDGAKLDCGILCENISIAAASLGLGSLICGIAGLAFIGGKGEEFRARLGFPEGFEFGIAVLLGYSAVPAKPHDPDKSKISWIG